MKRHPHREVRLLHLCWWDAIAGLPSATFCLPAVLRAGQRAQQSSARLQDLGFRPAAEDLIQVTHWEMTENNLFTIVINIYLSYGLKCLYRQACPNICCWSTHMKTENSWRKSETIFSPRVFQSDLVFQAVYPLLLRLCRSFVHPNELSHPVSLPRPLQFASFGTSNKHTEKEARNDLLHSETRWMCTPLGAQVFCFLLTKKGFSYHITLPYIPQGIFGFLTGPASVVTLICSEQLAGIPKTALCLGFRSVLSLWVSVAQLHTAAVTITDQSEWGKDCEDPSFVSPFQTPRLKDSTHSRRG